MSDETRQHSANSWVLFVAILVGIPSILAVYAYTRPIGPTWVLWRHEQDFAKGASVADRESENDWDIAGSARTKAECEQVRKRRLKASVATNEEWIKLSGGEHVNIYKNGFRFPFIDRDVEIVFLCLPATIDPRPGT